MSNAIIVERSQDLFEFIGFINRAIKTADQLDVPAGMEWRQKEVVKRLKQVKHILADVEQFDSILNSRPGWFDYKYEYLTVQQEVDFEAFHNRQVPASL